MESTNESIVAENKDLKSKISEYNRVEQDLKIKFEVLKNENSKLKMRAKQLEEYEIKFNSMVSEGIKKDEEIEILRKALENYKKINESLEVKFN